MQAFTHTEFIKKLLEDDSALAAKKQSIVFPFLKSDMHLYKYSDNSANAYIKLETISSRLKRLFGDNFVISVYITNYNLYGPKLNETQYMKIDTNESKTSSGRTFYKVAFLERRIETPPAAPAPNLEDKVEELSKQLLALQERVSKLENNE